MGINGQNAYRFLEQLSFPRASGSQAELRAADMIAARVRALGFTPVFQEFPVTRTIPELAEFTVTEPETVSYTVTGMVDAGETPEGGMDAEFYYLRYIDDISLRAAKGKFVLLNTIPTEKEYQRMMDAGIVGFLRMNGTMRDTPETRELDTLRFRDSYQSHGKVPAFAIRMSDAVKLLKKNPKRVHVELKLQEISYSSRNIIVEIPGRDLKDEVLVVGAHYDSTEFSSGAWDNGAGVVQILGLLSHLREHPPRRTVRAIFFGSEEIGLKGSKAYVTAPETNLQEICFMVNTDVGGSVLGYPMMVSTAVPDAEGFFNGLLCESEYSARLSSGIMSSDSAVFSDYGIPSVALGQFPPEGANYMHTRYDNFDRISQEVLEEEVRFLIHLVDKLANIPVFPIPRVIPKALRDKLVDYFGKAQSHTAAQTEFPEEPEPRRLPFG